MRPRLTRRASGDLEAIHLRGCAEFGTVAADAYLDGLWDTLAFLAEHPRAARERHEIDPPVRAHRHGSHLIVYRIEGDEIVVTRIPHGREDWPSSL